MTDVSITDFILWLHLFGLMLGAAGGMGSAILMRIALKRPAAEAAVLRSAGPALGRVALGGLALMWLTGLALIAIKYGGFSGVPLLFWVKIAFVLSLTFAAIALELTYGEIKRGNAAAAQRLPLFGPWAGLSSIAAVLFAVLAFH